MHSVAGREFSEFTRLAAVGDPYAPVPSCPGWAFVDLVRHVGRLHRWVAVIVGRMLGEAPRGRDIDDMIPDEPELMPAWQARWTAELDAALAAADPDAEVWTWGVDRRVRWWTRRMLHETTIHRVDAQLAFGETPRLGRDTAVDGVHELLYNLPAAVEFAPDIVKLTGAGERLALHAADTGDWWRITFQPDGFVWTTGRGAPPEADALIRAAATDLYLRVWGRPPVGAVTESGSPGLIRHWTINSAQ
ncbi:MAG: maleylpyruvate isomerase family mycothiol-dependent enzyme [Mycobacteriaceae bacterium]|nr:maleylpyruvate isomerase family mycothiol-dependent enzyme [Mycobacteriaceae bacterium]